MGRLEILLSKFIVTPGNSAKMKLALFCLLAVGVTGALGYGGMDIRGLHTYDDHLGNPDSWPPEEVEFIRCPTDGSPLKCRKFPRVDGLPNVCRDEYGSVYAPGSQSGHLTPKYCCPSVGLCHRP